MELLSLRDVVLLTLIVGTFIGAVATVLIDFSVTCWRGHQQHVAKARRLQALQARLDAIQRASGAWW